MRGEHEDPSIKTRVQRAVDANACLSLIISGFCEEGNQGYRVVVARQVECFLLLEY